MLPPILYTIHPFIHHFSLEHSLLFHSTSAYQSSCILLPPHLVPVSCNDNSLCQVLDPLFPQHYGTPPQTVEE